eukprot:1159932-Pelagomonas_calceolata.AAC.9
MEFNDTGTALRSPYDCAHREGTSNMGGKDATALWQAWCVLEAREKELPPNQMRQMFRKAVECNPRSRYVGGMGAKVGIRMGGKGRVGLGWWERM